LGTGLVAGRAAPVAWDAGQGGWAWSGAQGRQEVVVGRCRQPGGSGGAGYAGPVPGRVPRGKAAPRMSSAARRAG